MCDLCDLGDGVRDLLCDCCEFNNLKTEGKNE